MSSNPEASGDNELYLVDIIWGVCSYFKDGLINRKLYNSQEDYFSFKF